MLHGDPPMTVGSVERPWESSHILPLAKLGCLPILACGRDTCPHVIVFVLEASPDHVTGQVTAYLRNHVTH